MPFKDDSPGNSIALATGIYTGTLGALYLVQNQQGELKYKIIVLVNNEKDIVKNKTTKLSNAYKILPVDVRINMLDFNILSAYQTCTASVWSLSAGINWHPLSKIDLAHRTDTIWENKIQKCLMISANFLIFQSDKKKKESYFKVDKR